MSTVLVQPTYHVELIDGREVQKPLPRLKHARIQTSLIRKLGNDLGRTYEVLSELNVLCGEDRLTPDVTVSRRDARYENENLADPAVFCVEILSPGQRLAELFDKADRLLKTGTPLCWIIWPERRKAWMYSANDLEEAKTHLRAPLHEDGSVEVELAAMWGELD